MNIIDLLHSVFNGILEIYIICFFFGTFAQMKKFKGRGIVLAILSTLFITSLYINKNPFLNFAFLMIVIYFISLLYKTKWYNSVFLSLAFSLLGSFAELIVAISSSYILGVDMATLKTGFYFVAGTILSKLFLYIIIAIIRVGKHTLPINNLKELWAYIIALPIVSTILVFILSDYMYLIEENSVKQTVTVISLFLLIFVNVFLFYVIDRISNYFKKEQELNIANELIENQKQLYKELFDSQEEIKKIRHDMKNVMLGILHEIETEDIDNAKKYIKNHCEILEKNTEGFVSGNSIIDSLLLMKRESAEKHDVIINIETELSHQINVDTIDFAILLGNALDNAIEATSTVISSQKIINVTVLTKNSNMVIVIKNPVDKRIDTSNLVTKKENKKLHGYGILQMESLAHKYGGQIFLDCSDNEFKTTIIISNIKNE